MIARLAANDVLTIWENNDTRRTTQEKRQEYFDGDQDILDETDTRYDGNPRNKVVTNWIYYVVSKHVGFIMGIPPSLSLKEGGVEIKDEEKQKKAISEYNDEGRKNDFNALDLELFEDAILYGDSVEVHSYTENDGITITTYDPLNWAFLYDEGDNLLAAVYKTTLAVGTWYEGKLLSDEVVLYTVYDHETITVYKEVPATSNGGDSTEAAQINLIFGPTTHHYGRIPVIRYRVTKDYSSFISDALITQQDVWNKIRSRNADDVEYNVDALLAVIGYHPEALFEKDENGVPFIDKLREHKILPLELHGDAKFLEKGNEVNKVSYDLQLTRGAVHLMAHLADTEKIVGTTGEASGIALKLKLQPQIDQSVVFTTYFKKGLRERVELLNSMWKIKKMTELTEFDITFSLNIPVNEIEIWQNIVGLDHLMTMEEQLKLIPSVKDPNAVAAAKRKEQEELTVSLPSVSTYETPPGRSEVIEAKRKDRQTNDEEK